MNLNFKGLDGKGSIIIALKTVELTYWYYIHYSLEYQRRVT